MAWQAWYLVALHVVGALLAVGRIGKKREPITPMEAVIGLCLSAFTVYCVLALAGVI